MGRKENRPEKCVSLYNDNEKRCDFHSIFVLFSSSSRFPCFVVASACSYDFSSKRQQNDDLKIVQGNISQPRGHRRRTKNFDILGKDQMISCQRWVCEKITTPFDNYWSRSQKYFLKSFHFEFSFPIKVKQSNGVLINNFYRDVLGGTTCLEKNLILSREKSHNKSAQGCDIEVQ